MIRPIDSDSIGHDLAESVAGQVIQATQRHEFVDSLRLRYFLCGMLIRSSICKSASVQHPLSQDRQAKF